MCSLGFSSGDVLAAAGDPEERQTLGAARLSRRPTPLAGVFLHLRRDRRKL